ncbi:hypothetical protein PspS35_19305 [Pseudomonas sp. S35]|uniref:Bbp19 family protein n=1 Tax=Pseudomonas sp. S35 TaxID=1573719 RepID=UPI00132ED354|nr:hypothetical protein [Pseudomonas sp. S35]QHF45835.1 hypothetical protein PspS35_19305 [Pseudomonas sp. S35]
MAEQKPTEQDLQDIADFKWLMGDSRGRRFMWRTMGRSRLFQSSIGPTDAVTNFNEGQRNVGLFLLSQVNDLTPDLYAVMAAENVERPADEQPQETDE